MTVSLGDYTDSLGYELNAAGASTVILSDDEAVGRLIDAFWEARLCGFVALEAWTCDDNGNITPSNAGPTWPDPFQPYQGTTTDIPRDYIQLIILLAGHRALITLLQNANVSTMARAGSVETSTQKSAQMFIAALKAVTSKIDLALTRLSDVGFTTVGIRDAVINNTCAVLDGDTWFTRGGGNYGTNAWDVGEY